MAYGKVVKSSDRIAHERVPMGTFGDDIPHISYTFKSELMR